jgi:hypothetical protein
MVRTLVALMLAIATGAAPFAADRCAISCESVRAAALAAAPPCHHLAASGERIGQIPAPCGQNHRDGFVTIAAARARADTTTPPEIVGPAPSVDRPDRPPFDILLPCSIDNSAGLHRQSPLRI